MSDMPNPQQGSTFDPSAAHQQTPKLRKVRGFPVQGQRPDGQQVTLLGLADAQQISGKVVATAPAFQVVLPLMDGNRSVDDIVTEVGRGLTREIIEPLIAQLDDAGLLQGPTFEAMKAEMQADFDKSDILPPGSTAQIADALVVAAVGQEATDEQKAEQGPAKLREAMDQWIDQALKDVDNPSFDTLPKAVIVPHIDYPRGWMNYAHVWGRLRVVDRPDRVVILGTNHFGEATGVCGCDKGFASPLGACAADAELIAAVRAELGDADAEKLFANRYDHEREHSIELQMPWVQHCLGADDAGNYPKVFAALIHDPAANAGESYDGNGLGFEPFVTALKAALEKVGGTTLIVSSADLSHVGPAFGDQQSLAGEEPEAAAMRQRTADHDREMLGMVVEKRMDDLIGAMAWQQNPTRWCSVGNMAAAMRVAEPNEVELLNYAAAMDQQGTTMVSSAALVMR